MPATIPTPTSSVMRIAGVRGMCSPVFEELHDRAGDEGDHRAEEDVQDDGEQRTDDRLHHAEQLNGDEDA